MTNIKTKNLIKSSLELMVENVDTIIMITIYVARLQTSDMKVQFYQRLPTAVTPRHAIAVATA